MKIQREIKYEIPQLKEGKDMNEFNKELTTFISNLLNDFSLRLNDYNISSVYSNDFGIFRLSKEDEQKIKLQPFLIKMIDDYRTTNLSRLNDKLILEHEIIKFLMINNYSPENAYDITSLYLDIPPHPIRKEGVVRRYKYGKFSLDGIVPFEIVELFQEIDKLRANISILEQQLKTQN